MNKAIPWRIKGVGFDARAAAIEAARRSGLSLGEWLNTVIADQAAADGVEENEFDAQDRLDAVRRRLSTLRDGNDDQQHAAPDTHGETDARTDDGLESSDDRGRHARAAGGPSRARPARSRYDDAPEADDRRPTRRPDPFREQIDAEALLENAIAAFDRRTSRSSERTARALAEVAALIDTSRSERRRDDAALASIADRLTHIENKVARPQPPAADRSVADALTRLERRLDGLARTTSSAAVAAATAPQAQAAPTPGVKRPLAAAIAEVARRQQELDDTAGGSARLVAARMPTAPLSAVADAPAMPAADAGPSPMEKRLAALVERLEKQTSQAATPAPAPVADLSGLQGNIDTLTDRIEKMRGEIASRASAPERSDDGIADIRREIAAMAKAVADLAPRTSIAALEDAVRDLARRITDSRIEGVGEAALAPVEALLSELVSVVRGMDSRASLEALDRSIRGVFAKLEAFDGAAVADPALARGIAEQTREMHDMLARIHANQLPAERIEQGLADLSRRVEAIAATGADPLGRGEMVQRVDEVRAMLDDPKMQEQVLQALERRLDAIATRIDAVFGERLDSMQRSVAGLRQQTVPDLDALVGDLGARIDAALAGGLKAMERTVTRLVEAAPARSETPPSRLEEMVRELAARVEHGAAPDAHADSLDAIARQIERLSQHFDRSDSTAETLNALQHSVADLFARLEQSQHQAIDLAEIAARTAAADVLRAGAPAPDVSREMAEIRSLQDAADHRTHATLTAVHDTLSEVVGRLSMLESDIADVRSTAVVPVPPPSMPGMGSAFHAARDPDAPPRSRTEPGPEPRPAPRDLDDAGDDILIEPGAAFDRRSRDVDSDERVEHRPQASFIQAARRAAQAAGAASDAAMAEPVPAPGRRAVGKAGAPLDQIRAYYASRKRPILLSLAALMVLVGAWQVARVMTDERPPAPAPAVQAPKVSALPSPMPPREKADKAATPEAAPAAAPAPEVPARKVETQALPPDPAPAPAAPVDRAPVGSIAPPVQTADTNGIVRALAVSGDPAAQYELAVRYADGKLLARDLKLSQQWFEKAAAKGVVPAQYRLGALYERGIGVPKDPAQAKTWYQRAADAGNARAMHNLAVLYADGSEGKPDYADAIVWFRRAAEMGVRDSQYNLAILYARGLGTAVNMVESYLWFAAAAAQGDEDAAKKREDVAARLPAADLARAKALAAAFKAKPLDAAANEVTPPPGGWESMKPPPRPDAKSSARPKMSNL